MALSEFVAMETAYRALAPLDSAARGRALHWLTDVLGASQSLSDAAGEGSTHPEAIAAVPVRSARTGARGSTAKVESPTTSGREAAAKRGGRRAGSVARGSRRGSAPKAPAAGGERAYRRMPDPEVVLAAYRKVGTVSGLAGHFGVPRHTIQGWARRLRREGYEIGRPV